MHLLFSALSGHKSHLTNLKANCRSTENEISFLCVIICFERPGIFMFNNKYQPICPSANIKQVSMIKLNDYENNIEIDQEVILA